MEQVNRMAVMVFVREPFADWLNSVDPDRPVWIGDLSGRGNVYLIPEFDDTDQAEEHVEEIYDEIFRNELAEWHENESCWPQERSYDMFLEWFDLIYDVAAFDTVDELDEDAHN